MSWFTFRSAELDSIRHGTHPFRVTCLDLEVVGGIKGQLLNLMGQPVPHYWFNDPVMNLCIHISAVVNDVTWKGREKVIQRHIVMIKQAS